MQWLFTCGLNSGNMYSALVAWPSWASAVEMMHKPTPQCAAWGTCISFLQPVGLDCGLPQQTVLAKYGSKPPCCQAADQAGDSQAM